MEKIEELDAQILNHENTIEQLRKQLEDKND